MALGDTGLSTRGGQLNRRTEDVVEATWQRGIALIHTMQLAHGPVLDTVLKAITALGEEELFLVLLPLLFWCVDPAVGARLLFAFLPSSYLNSLLKDVFAHPRPYELDPTLKLHDAEGYGLPSGHAQLAVVVWGVIAAEFRRAWLWVVVILLMALIGFSRIYLGVHFPTDVLGGWALGAVSLVAYLALAPRFEAWVKKAGLVAQLVLSVAASAALLLVHPTADTVPVTAVLAGAGVGVALSQRIAPPYALGPLWQRAARFLVGVVGLLALYIGLRLVLPDEGASLYLAMRFVRYMLLGLWTALGAPWLFQRLGLAPQTPEV